ncbi:hypothetical protein [Spirillospora sp. NPDC047279]|uniref:hypothetical protein n=1 Tax=Spirillospora sp. NPDC047279 TaxID=3155478 RepID=UPI0033F40B76
MAAPAPTQLRPGDQLASTVCTTRVVVVRAPAGSGAVLTCGEAPMVPASTVPAAKPGGGGQGGDDGTGTLIGKRYTDAGGTIELLCTMSGAGELRCDDAPMTLKSAKPLPASD